MKVHDLTVAYGKDAVLSHLSFEAQPGDRIHLSGPSGAGKTTLLSVLAGLLPPTEGTVTVDGTVAFLFQDSRLLPWLTAEENVRFVLPRGKEALAEPYLRAVELWEERTKRPDQLSGGMCRRVALARALAYAEATNAALLLLDEPLTGVDEDRKARLYPLLTRAAENRILLLSTHDPAEATALCNRKLTLA